jgi:uncharacterized integral membrane protein
MARTKRASTRRTSTRKASTRRTSTKRTSTKRRKPKGLRLTRKKQKQILIIVGIIVALLILIALLQNPRTYVQKKYYAGEVGRNIVYGKVTSVAIGAAGRGTIRVRSFNTGKTYTFYTGLRTRYNVKRYPHVGNNAKVYYVNDRGYRKATYVRIR